MIRAAIGIVLLASVVLYSDATITWTLPTIVNGTGTLTTPVPENAGIGEIKTVKVEATGTAVTYDIKPVSSVFGINTTTGVISVKSALDYETTPAYTITVVATDGADTDTAVVTLSVGNVNPEFTPKTQSACVADGADAGSAVVTVNPPKKDKTTDAAIVYSIDAGNAKSMFALNTATGVITVGAKKKLDKKTDASFTLSVKASITGAPATTHGDTVALTVKVGDCPGGVASLTSPINILALLVALMIALS